MKSSQGFIGAVAVLRWSLVVLALCLLGLGGTAQADTRRVTPQTIDAALANLAPGTELELEAGTYSAITIRRVSGTANAPIVLRSADPANPAFLRGLVVRDAAHIHLETLVFDYVFSAGDPRHARPFLVQDSQNIRIAGSVFDGDLASGEGPPHDGFPTSYGLLLADAQNIRILSNTFHTQMRAIVVNNSRNLTISGNDISRIRSDGVNFAQVQDVLFENNHIHDFMRSTASGDHADMLQIWTRGTTEPTRGVTIRGNIFNAGMGHNTQSIFMRNDQVDRGLAGYEMFYRDITIDDNVIINAHSHGITVGATDGLRIRNNTVVRNIFAAGENPQRRLWTPQISAAENSVNVEILRNVTREVIGYEGQSSWSVADNLLVQGNSRLEPGFYGLYFNPASTVDPRHVASFRALAGGPLDGTGIGASRLSRP